MHTVDNNNPEPHMHRAKEQTIEPSQTTWRRLVASVTIALSSAALLLAGTPDGADASIARDEGDYTVNLDSSATDPTEAESPVAAESTGDEELPAIDGRQVSNYKGKSCRRRHGRGRRRYNRGHSRRRSRGRNRHARRNRRGRGRGYAYRH